jgi:hypothetical protein
MSQLSVFMELGFRHITDRNGVDHMLFLLALAAVYRLREWRSCLKVVTAFTVGHSLTLALATTGLLRLPTAIIEFLIPVTIVLTGLEGALVRAPIASPVHTRWRMLAAGVFGLVHGAGFANYLRSLFVEHIVVPLVGFNVGVEIGQVLVLAIAGVVLTLLDVALGRGMLLARTGARLPAAPRLRAIMISALVTIVAAGWAVERRPW